MIHSQIPYYEANHEAHYVVDIGHSKKPIISYTLVGLSLRLAVKRTHTRHLTPLMNNGMAMRFLSQTKLALSDHACYKGKSLFILCADIFFEAFSRSVAIFHQATKMQRWNAWVLKG